MSRYLFISITGVVFMGMAAQAPAGNPAERTWSGQTRGGEYPVRSANENTRYNPWSTLGSERLQDMPEQPRYIERTERRYQPEALPAYPSPLDYRGVPMSPVAPIAPPGGYYAPIWAYPAHPPYPGMGGYPGAGYSPYGSGLPGMGIMPRGFMPW